MINHKPKSSFSRSTRIATQILVLLSDIIHKKINTNQFGLITLSDVKLTADFSYAKVYFTILKPELQLIVLEDIEDFLNKRANWLHARLYKLLNLRKIPLLKFIYDKHTIKCFRLNSLINKANLTNNL